MRLDHLWLTDFRNYREAEFAPAPDGITAVTGSNGEGKTNLIEAVGYLATLRSLRGSPAEALVRDGAPNHTAIVRAEGRRDSRRVLIEAELRAVGRDRVQVNGQALRRTRDLLGALQVTVFTPDDLVLVKGGPQARRDYLDDLLVALHPRHDATITEVDRVLKQRNTLLKSVAGLRSPPAEVISTLDVWDAKLAGVGEDLAAARAGLAEALEPRAADAYRRVAIAVPQPPRATISLSYRRSWAGPLIDALGAARHDDLRRGVTTVGPHRDELDLLVGGFAARSHGSQGEQRSLTLALRLAGHDIVTERIASAPILLLDDVFSELDSARAEALLTCLPAGQAIITTATDLPRGAVVEARYRVEGGKILS